MSRKNRTASRPTSTPSTDTASRVVAVPVPAIVAGTTVVPVPVPRPASNAMTDVQRAERVGDLITMLRDSTGDRAKGKKIRRMLRALGHRGGLRSTSPL